MPKKLEGTALGMEGNISHTVFASYGYGYINSTQPTHFVL